MGKGIQKVQTFSCKISKLWRVLYSMATIVNNDNDFKNKNLLKPDLAC